MSMLKLSGLRPLAQCVRSGRPLGSRILLPMRLTSNWARHPAAVQNKRFIVSLFSGTIAGVVALGMLNTVHADTAEVISPQISAQHNVVSIDELKQHTNVHSLWMAVEGMVYDVTDFARVHPGGTKILLENAGKDVTKLFNSIHPAKTIQKSLNSDSLVGILDPQAVADSKTDEEYRIESARASLIGVDSVVSLSDFERYAKDLLPTHALAYYSTGADGEFSLQENAAAIRRIYFRPRVMRNVRDIDTRTTVLGVESAIPIYVSPTARNGLGQAQGEVAVTLGAGQAGILQVLSHYASRSLEDVISACRGGQKIGWQLYLKQDRSKSEEEVKEAVRLGAHSIWITVDTTILGKRESERRTNAELKPAPHGRPLTRSATSYGSSEDAMSWDDISWIRRIAPGLPIVVKGVGAWEDVALAYKYGADAVVLSNHGGRQLDYAQPPIKTLADVRKYAPETLGQADFAIFLDGGVRHGTDVLKALCLGARAVGLGRPFIYAATGWGAEGVEKAVMILQEEIEIGMKLLGVTRVEQLGPEYLDTSRL